MCSSQTRSLWEASSCMMRRENDGLPIQWRYLRLIPRHLLMWSCVILLISWTISPESLPTLSYWGGFTKFSLNVITIAQLNLFTTLMAPISPESDISPIFLQSSCKTSIYICLRKRWLRTVLIIFLKGYINSSVYILTSESLYFRSRSMIRPWAVYVLLIAGSRGVNLMMSILRVSLTGWRGILSLIARVSIRSRLLSTHSSVTLVLSSLYIKLNAIELPKSSMNFRK